MWKRDPNLDHDPAFWLMVLTLVPCVLAASAFYRLSVLRDRFTRRR